MFTCAWCTAAGEELLGEGGGRIATRPFRIVYTIVNLYQLYASPDNLDQSSSLIISRGGGGGGGHSTFMWTGGAAGGRKPDPVAMRSVHKNTPYHNIPY